MSDKDIMPPRAAGQYIADHSLDVKVSQDGVENAALKVCDIVVSVLLCFEISQFGSSD